MDDVEGDSVVRFPGNQGIVNGKSSFNFHDPDVLAFLEKDLSFAGVGRVRLVVHSDRAKCVQVLSGKDEENRDFLRSDFLCCKIESNI